MLKYQSTAIGIKEIPEEISLIINISNCRIKCPRCNAKPLWKDVGTPLTADSLDGLILPILADITCVTLMGGDIAPDEVNDLAAHIRQRFPKLKIAWYSGRDTVSVFTDYKNFDYIKLGPYIASKGGLENINTNQRLYEVMPNGLKDITFRFR